MSRVILPSQRFLSQPQFPFPIDYKGLGKGMQILWNPAIGPIDLVTRRIWTPGNNASITASQKGKVFSFDGVDDYYGYTGYPEITSNIGTFFLWLPVVGAPDGDGHVYFAASSPVVCGHQVNQLGRIIIGTGSGASSGSLSGWFNTKNRSIVFVSNGTAAGTKAFVDGKDTGYTWSNPPTAWGAGNKNFNLGRYIGGTTFDFSGSILIAGNTSAVWGSTEAKAFHENPWQMFSIPSRKSWVVSQSAITYTITPSGQLSLLGSSEIIKTRIFLPSGDITFSGTNNLVKEKVINPTGNVILSGDNSLVKTKVVNPSGKITFSGTSVPVKSKVLDASGTIAFSGTASLSGAMSYLLSPTGQLTLSGTSKLIKTHIQIPTGGIVFSGSAPIESNTFVPVVSTRLPLTGAGQ